MTKRNGVREWLFQRFSNLLIILFSAVYLGLLLTNAPLNYEKWLAMHSAMWFKLYGSFTLVCVMLNALLAGWQIGTDYTQKVPINGFDKIYTLLYFIPTLVYLFAGIFIFWWLI